MGSELFKRTVKTVTNERKNLSHIVLDNIEERKSFLKLEQFLSKTMIMISPTFDSYMTDSRPIKRILAVCVMKSATILFLIRYGMSIIFSDNHFISVVLMSNASHILGNKVLISCVFFGGHMVTFTFSNLIQYFDWTSKLTVVEYMYEIKNLVIGVRLTGEYRKKYYKKMNFITKHFSWPLLGNMVINSALVIVLPPIVAYIIEPEMGFSLVSIIIWTPITLLAIIDFNATCLGVFRFWFLSLTYLRYQFKRVNDRIETSIRYKNYDSLKRALDDHNYCCVKTAKLNETFNYLIIAMYFVAKPTLNILAYITHAEGTNHFTRIAATNILFFCLTAIFSVNLLCASVTACAHKPLKHIYQLYKDDKFDAIQKLKALAFIEKLSGPVIGFYCYKLYPMNNYQFYQSTCGWAYNYFLVINLISDLNF